MNNKTSSLSHRLTYFIDSQGYPSVRKFEQSVGVKQGTIQRAINTGSINADNLIKIGHAHPELRIDWLVSGTGDMIKISEAEQQSLEASTTALENMSISARQLSSTVERLTEMNDKLQDQLISLVRYIVDSSSSSSSSSILPDTA